MRSLMAALVMGGAVAASVGAQSNVTIDPGMSRDQVVAKLGEPLSARTYDSHTYMLYKNGCEKTCGMNDLVILDSGKVVDAVFRATGRRYSGTSSSPRMISEVEAKRSNGGAPLVIPVDEPKAPPKAPAKVASPAPTKTAAPAPAKTATPAPAKTATPAVTKSAPPPPPKKADVAPAKTNTAAPAKKTEPAPPPKKSDAVPGKTPDSTKKKPTSNES